MPVPLVLLPGMNCSRRLWDGVVLVVRAGRRTSPAARAKREIFSNDAFKTLRAQLGEQAGEKS